MILFFSAKEPQLSSPIDPRFGRCPHFIKVDSEEGKWEAFSNPGFTQSGGAGVAAAQFIIDYKPAGVVSGDFGPHAFKALQAAGVAMYLYADGSATVSGALDQFRQGNLARFEPGI